MFLLLASLAVPVLGSRSTDPQWYETLALAGTAVSFFWVSGLFDAYVVRSQAVDPVKRENVLLATFWMATLFSAFSAGTLLLTAREETSLWNGYALFLFFELGGFVLPMSWLSAGKGKLLIVLGLLYYGVYAILIAAGIWSAWSLESVFLVAAGWSGIRWAVAVFSIKPWNGFGERDAWVQLLRLGLPIAGVAILSQSAWVLDGYMVKEFFPEAFASYRYGSKEFPLVLLLANAFSMAYAGQIAAGLREEKVLPFIEKMKVETLPIIHLCFSLTVVLVLVSSFLFEGVLGKEYAAAIPVFDICMLLAIPRLVFPQTIVRGYQHGFVLTMSATAELIVKVGMSFALMPLMGISGLVLATVIGFAVEKAILVMYCSRRLGHEFGSYTPLGAWVGWSVLLLATIAVKYLLFSPL